MKKVLIVDDAAFMRVSIKNMLGKNGYEVIGEAENGKVAIQKFQDLAPDVVTMDITMSASAGSVTIAPISASSASMDRGRATPWSSIIAGILHQGPHFCPALLRPAPPDALNLFDLGVTDMG